MNKDDYKAERKLRGTQTAVAALLGVGQVTIARRETGVSPITQEMMLAVCAIKKMRKKKKASVPSRQVKTFVFVRV